MNRARTWLNTIKENTVLEKVYEEATFGDQQNGTSRSPSMETLFSTAVGSLLQIVQARASDTPGHQTHLGLDLALYPSPVR